MPRAAAGGFDSKTHAPGWPEGVTVGTVLEGKYRVERLIGSGGMGIVVEATHLHLERRVAVKFPRADPAKKPASRKRFLREARASFSVRSEHVVRVLDFGHAPPESPFIVMEYLEGSSVADLIAARGAVPYVEAARIAMQAMHGVEAVHQAGIIHRDLKPSNLFAVTLPGGGTTIKVLDFGLALEEASVDANLTESGAVFGSVSYMSPEQLRCGPVDARSDVWALGVLLYELMTGKLPFTAASPSAVVAKILVEPPVALEGLAEVPAPVAAIVHRCLSKSPTDRFASVAALRAALAEHVAESPLPHQRPGPSIADDTADTVSTFAPSGIGVPTARRSPLKAWTLVIATSGLAIAAVLYAANGAVASGSAAPPGVQEPRRSRETARPLESAAPPPVITSTPLDTPVPPATLRLPPAPPHAAHSASTPAGRRRSEHTGSEKPRAAAPAPSDAVPEPPAAATPAPDPLADPH